MRTWLKATLLISSLPKHLNTNRSLKQNSELLGASLMELLIHRHFRKSPMVTLLQMVILHGDTCRMRVRAIRKRTFQDLF